MSESQKWITAISGAVIGQIAVLGFFYLMVSNSTSPGLSAKTAPPQQREVTVMLSHLVEQLPEEKLEELLPPEAEEPPDDEIKGQRSFVNTDSSTARAEAPKNARFESDRNTTASTEFLPDANLPKTQGPTLRGEDKIENLSLADQEYNNGEIKSDATPSPSIDQPAAPPAPPVEITEPDTPTDKLSQAEAQEAKPGKADTPPQQISEKITQPDSPILEKEAKLAATTQTFSDPNGAAQAMEIQETEQKAIATTDAEENGAPAAPEEKKEIKAAPAVSEPSIETKKQTKVAETEIQKKLDESMFNPAYLAHQRKNNQNGDITVIGEGSVDAESTPTGKYKKAVRQAIGRTWHRYREDRAEQVTWGLLKVEFSVTPAGKIQNLDIVKKEATELVTEFSLKAIMDADIPPMSKEVAATLGPAGLEMHYNIVIY